MDTLVYCNLPFGIGVVNVTSTHNGDSTIGAKLAKAKDNLPIRVAGVRCILREEAGPPQFDEQSRPPTISQWMYQNGIFYAADVAETPIVDKGPVEEMSDVWVARDNGLIYIHTRLNFLKDIGMWSAQYQYLVVPALSRGAILDIRRALFRK